jgi:hypothetical protein
MAVGAGLAKGDPLRWLARVPGWWAVLLLFGIAILIALSAWTGNRPPPVTDTPAPTAPVAEPQQ